ncbi:vacuolar protein sorting/targeting protein PEP1 [Coemansia biformis]|uniref:Vacuolar protein sorting/targeting protein PEP1 n=1 Tax=Coemansia biformis TaxID=1286918 RepID=A0A9W8D0H5_9FUNG|nr:vacuolar protein sorting/targeting protein PEP1 [Coemansia biformis]
MRWAALAVLPALLASGGNSGVAAASGREPAVRASYFKEALSKLMYFRNPQVLLGLDRDGGRVYRSANGGAQWDQTAIPEGKAARLYAHPYEAQTAYVLSADKVHWVTRDEGRTWEAFSTPVAPTSSGERPLSFHATRPRWVLFTGERCQEEVSGRWPFPRLVCRDEPYYTRDGFQKAVHDHAGGDTSGGAITALLKAGRFVTKCLWARHTKEFDAMAEAAIFCLETLDTRKGKSRSLHTRGLALANTSPARVHYGAALRRRQQQRQQRRAVADSVAELLDALAAHATVRLVVSEDFFASEREVHFGAGNDGTGGDRAGGGVVAVSVVRGFVLAAISHAHSDEMDLFVSVDGHTWAESHLPLPPGSQEDAYTVLEPTRHAVLVDVLASTGGAAGSLFRSNSNGTYYTLALEHTHRSADGLVDVERVHGIEGVLIANQVANWEHILASRLPELRTRVSFDDGARWRFLQPPERGPDGSRYGCSRDGHKTGACALHLHSVTSSRTPGRVFGAPAAPGVVLAMGSVGSHLEKRHSCDMFLSRDGALSWTAVRKGAHHAQLADAGAAIVLAVADEDTDKATYSLDGGSSWQTASLGVRMRVTALLADDEGLSPTVLAVGSVHGGSHEGEQALVAIDFAQAWSRQCSVDASDPKPNNDMEKFVLGAHGDSGCVMGHRSDYVRRKPSAQCAMRLSRVLLPRQEDCECAPHDFECDYNYAPNDAGGCTLAGAEVVPKGECQHPGDHYMGSSGYRLVPGDTCARRRGKNMLDEPIKRPCPRVQPPSDPRPADGSPTRHSTTVRGDPHTMAFPNSTAYIVLTSQRELLRTDDRGAGWAHVDLPKGAGVPVFLADHPYHTHRAFVYTEKDMLLYTDDRGVSWRPIKGLPAPANGLRIRPLLDFNPENPDWLLFVGGTRCPSCHTEVYVSRDNGARWSRITTHATKCRFARTHKFSALPAEAVLCTNLRVTSGRGSEQDEQMHNTAALNRVEARVFLRPFESSAHELIPVPDAEHSEVVDFSLHGRFIVFAVVHGVPGDTGKAEAALKLFVSDDGRTMHEARFPPSVNIRPEGYTLLPSHAGTILVDVEGAPNTGDPSWGTGWGTLFASTSNGTHFHRVLEHTNRNRLGMVDVERVEGLSGMLIANRVINADALGQTGVHKRLHTVASWDDGRTWHSLTPPAKDSAGRAIDCADCTLNLFSRSAMVSVGRLYSAPSAPGILLGIGSVDTHLGRYMQSHTYMSRDGGISWVEVSPSESQYEFVDHGALLVTVDDSAPTDTLRYSADGGRTWMNYRFSDSRVVIDRITNGMTSGGQSVLIQGRVVTGGGVSQDETQLTSVDFSGIHKHQCVLDEHDHSRSDFELWTPRWSSRDAICVLGAETSYWRRKPASACYVGDEFKPAQTRERPCECTAQDFECDEGFWLNDYGQCELDGPDPGLPKDCRDGTTYMGRSGYRRNPWSKCTGGKDLSAPVERVCGRSGGVRATAHVVDGPVTEVQYFKNSVHVVARTESGSVYVSLDEGGRWAPLDPPERKGAAGKDAPVAFASIVRQPYFENYAYFMPRKGAVALFTDDEARTTRLLHLPAPPAHAYQPALRFHPEYPDWLVFLGQPNEGCTHVDGSACKAEAFVSRDHGAHWEPLLAPVGPGGCSFLRTMRTNKVHRHALVCMRYPQFGHNGADVVVSDNWFKRSDVLVANATDYAIVSEFLLVSQDAGEGKALTMHISHDGRTAEVAQFPGDKRTLDPAYTVLEPSDGFEYRDLNGFKQKMPDSGLMLHVTKSGVPGKEWGTLYSSNSEGVSYRRALEHVNRDEIGLVDFERVRALEGVAIANVVANPQAVLKGESKQLQTMITTDGGSRWHYLRVDQAPCRQTAPQGGGCALHLHGYTEVSDPENIYSASGAVGMVMGVGNVGGHLKRIGEASTYLSVDGGANWRLAHKGPKWHEFGDHGALIVAADRLRPVSAVDYSLDQGKTWHALSLPDAARSMRVESLTTTPDSTSRRFLLFGTRAGKGVLVGLDLSGAQPRVCVFDPKNKSHDFELFAPTQIDPAAENECRLGRKVQYYRRVANQECYVGSEFQPVHFISSRCECTERDYECNHNFVRRFASESDTVGECVLIEGMKPPRTNCTEGHRDYFLIEAPYRRIPQSICQNGVVLDRPTEVWCPGKARTVAIIWSLVLPVVFLGLAYVGYRRWRDNYPYLRLEDIGSVVRPAIHNLRHSASRNDGVLKQLEPVFVGAVATAGAVGSATREAFLWGLDKAAPYLPHALQRWSYEHPPRWGAARAMDGRSRRAIRDGDGGRFTYRPLATNEDAQRVFGSYDDGATLDAEDPDEYDEFEAQFNHFLDEENEQLNHGVGEGEGDARVVDRQVLFANTELSDDEA